MLKIGLRRGSCNPNPTKMQAIAIRLVTKLLLRNEEGAVFIVVIIYQELRLNRTGAHQWKWLDHAMNPVVTHRPLPQRYFCMRRVPIIKRDAI